MAVGKAGEKADRDRLSISVGGVAHRRKAASRFRAMTKRRSPRIWQGREIQIDVDLGIGTGRATVWTCDLTHGYIDINGSYRS